MSFAINRFSGRTCIAMSLAFSLPLMLGVYLGRSFSSSVANTDPQSNLLKLTSSRPVVNDPLPTVMKRPEVDRIAEFSATYLRSDYERLLWALLLRFQEEGYYVGNSDKLIVKPETWHALTSGRFRISFYGDVFIEEWTLRRSGMSRFSIRIEDGPCADILQIARSRWALSPVTFGLISEQDRLCAFNALNRAHDYVFKSSAFFLEKMDVTPYQLIESGTKSGLSAASVKLHGSGLELDFDCELRREGRPVDFAIAGISFSPKSKDAVASP